MTNRWKEPIGIETLRQRIARLEQPRARGGAAAFSSGFGPLDRLLPEGGFRRGSLAEWLSADDGGGAATLAFRAACRACHDGGGLVVLDHRREFYPPAAIRLGVDPDHLVVVHVDDRADDHADYRWALDQALRCRGVAAVVAWPERLDGHTFRRLQLAVEDGGGLGLLIRPPAARQEPSWADVRLLVEPLPVGDCPDFRVSENGTVPLDVLPGNRRLRVHLLRCRGGVNGRTIDLELDDETHPVHLAASLADPAAAGRAARA